MGLYEAGRLVGAAIFSEPANPRVIPSWCGVDRSQGMELGRFVLLDRIGYNAESWFWARARRLVGQHKPEVRVLLAYSDPVRRRDAQGRLVLPGHVGTIYQATNARYLGRSSPRTLYLDRHGQPVSGRAITKIGARACGHAYARAHLEEASQTSQRATESVRDWIQRARSQLTRLRHPGNHVYAWDLSGDELLDEGLPYPRQIDPEQLGLLESA